MTHHTGSDEGRLSDAEREALWEAIERAFLDTTTYTRESEANIERAVERILADRTAAPDALRSRMLALADEFDAKGRRGSAHFGADIGDTIRLWVDRDPRAILAERPTDGSAGGGV